MSLELVNSTAKRDVVKTSRFTSLMKAGNCQSYKNTDGDTKHSVDAIQEIAYKFAHQTKAVAKALLGKTVAETVTNNYNFLYSHIQYQADPQLQQMRSPNCSWAERFTGIDCKSYSILASTLLINQGIGHYIRRIKQPSYQPSHWTHVYVIIPTNQSTYNLNEGYYIIDATLHQNIESKFLEKHDTLMNKLPHIWLNGPSVPSESKTDYENAIVGFETMLQSLANNGVSGLTITQIYNVIENSMRVGKIPLVEFKENAIVIDNKPFIVGFPTQGLAVSLDDFSNIFGSGWSPSCIGGTFDKKDEDATIPALITYFQEKYDAFNQALASQNVSQIQSVAQNIIDNATKVTQFANSYKNYNWSSSCSRRSTENIYNAALFYKNIALNVFYPYLQKYFNFNTSVVNEKCNTYDIPTRVDGQGLYTGSFTGCKVDVIKVSNLQFKGTLDIPYFELNSYVVDNVQSGFNLENFINTLSTVAIQFQGSSNNGNGTQNGSSQNGNGYTDVQIPPPSQAGFNWFQGLLIAGVVIGGGVMYANSEKASKTKSKSKKSA